MLSFERIKFYSILLNIHYIYYIREEPLVGLVYYLLLVGFYGGYSKCLVSGTAAAEAYTVWKWQLESSCNGGNFSRNRVAKRGFCRAVVFIFLHIKTLSWDEVQYEYYDH